MNRADSLRQTLELIKETAKGPLPWDRHEAVVMRIRIFDAARAALEMQRPQEEDEEREDMSEIKLWLWKNFVDGKPEYWAFDNPYPCHPNGDPMVLGSPCGYAIFKDSDTGRPEKTESEVLAEIECAKARGMEG